MVLLSIFQIVLLDFISYDYGMCLLNFEGLKFKGVLYDNYIHVSLLSIEQTIIKPLTLGSVDTDAFQYFINQIVVNLNTVFISD